MNTHPEMNAKIVSILQISGSPTSQYAAQRIKELKAELAVLRTYMNFKVIDLTTGKAPDTREIALTEAWAKDLMYPDMEGVGRVPPRS